MMQTRITGAGPPGRRHPRSRNPDLAGLGGCASFLGFLGHALVPVETEIELGRRLAAKVEAEHRVLRDSRVQRYVRFLAQPLIEQAWRDRPGIDYRVTVLDDPARSTPSPCQGGRPTSSPA